MRPIREARQILVRGVDTIGTFVLATPFYRELRCNFPLANITLCVKPLVYDLARACPYADEIIVYDKKKYGGELGFIRELRKRNFDTAFVLSGSFHSALLCFLAGIKMRIGYPHDHRGWLLTHRVKEDIKLRKHCVEYLLDIIISIGCEVKQPATPELYFDEALTIRGREILSSSGVDLGKRIIGVGFGVAGEKSREWLKENWASLIEMLVSDGKTAVVLFGSVRDKEDGDRIANMVSKYKNSVVNLCGKTTLSEFSGCLKNISLYVSVDTGGIHIASALGIPVVGLYVPGSDDRWSPRSSDKDKDFVKIISKKDAVVCAPCNQSKMKHCYDNLCMKAISVNEVFESVKMLLSKI